MPIPQPRLAIVLPCYKEEEALPINIPVLIGKLKSCVEGGLIAADSYLFFIDDGSTDKTWDILVKMQQQYPQYISIAGLAANRGKEYALWAGLMEIRQDCDVAVCMDADLQFDIEALDEFLAKYQEGYELIYGIKENRGKQSGLRHSLSHGFYSIMGMLGTPLLRNHTDYSLMTRQVIDALSEYEEAHLMFRVMLKSLGFRQCAISFKVLDREQGESKFSLSRLVKLSLDAITSFSVVPLRFIACLGLCITVVSVMMMAWIVVDYFRGITPTGWATLNFSIWFIGGTTMLCMSILGEYVGKTYMESKRRPRYFVSRRIKQDSES